jgi:hypothetical protein
MGQIAKKGVCTLCGAKGRQHAAGNCGVTFNENGTVRRARKRKKAKRHADIPVRGVVVAGTGKPKEEGK